MLDSIGTVGTLLQAANAAAHAIVRNHTRYLMVRFYQANDACGKV
jgi:hypothetical protein